MKYRYLYQTKENENREGEIVAASREDAYAKIRKLGIRPYRVIGDDPSPWRRRALIAASAVAALALGAGIVIGVLALRGPSPLSRAELGVTAVEFEKLADENWTGAFAEELDRVLVEFAKPGRDTDTVPPTGAEAVRLAAARTRPLPMPETDRESLKRLVRVVRGLRRELDDFLAKGGTAEGYFVMLGDRQREECAFRDRAANRVAETSESVRREVWLGINARLAERGIEPLPRPEGVYAPEENAP